MVLNRLKLLILLGCLGLSCPGFAATVYKWIDEEGKLHYTHTLPPNYSDVPHQVMSTSGITLEDIAGAPTPEERERLAAARQTELERISRAQEQQRRDQALLAVYHSEQEIREALQSEMENIAMERALIEQSYGASERGYASLVSKAANLERAGQRVDTELLGSMVKVRTELGETNQRLVALDARVTQTEAAFNLDLRRFQELSSR